jgi:hypothetical protein
MAILGLCAGLAHRAEPLQALLETGSGVLAAVSAFLAWRLSPFARRTAVLWALLLMFTGAWSERDLLLRNLTPLSENWLDIVLLLGGAALALITFSTWLRKLEPPAA